MHDVVKAEYVGEYKINLIFDDGRSGVVDFAAFIDQGGVFERLRRIDRFKDFRIDEELGVLTWDDQVDIAPEVLYSKATNSPLPGWMEH
ncbi:MAG TPA: DUF2442 domain-containing protein [Phycisphaerales bacterium]|nr:DUF2442 domain-containing protein [Phycisphaerales bacterium]